MFYNGPVSNSTEEQIGVFKRLSIPRVSAPDWDARTAKLALRELRRLRGELASAQAILIGVMKTETGRDTKATLSRGFGMSAAEAAKAEAVADVVTRIPGADDALANGTVTGEHLRKLAPITNPTDAAELFALAPSQTPDDFAKTVDRYRIEKDADGWRARQRNARSVRFFKADDGCTAIRAILPTLDGERVKAAINQACDNAWRAAHPERAHTTTTTTTTTTTAATDANIDTDAPDDEHANDALPTPSGHHTHRHETNNNITRQPNSPWAINNEQPEPRPPAPPASPPSRPRHVRTPRSTQEGHERLHRIRCRLRQTARAESAKGDRAEAPTNSSERARPDGAEAPTNSSERARPDGAEAPTNS